MSDKPPVPVIPHIHQRVYEAASQPDALDMAEWHTCDTTHCRAGWVIHLAGKAGYALERWCRRGNDLLGSGKAAAKIYAASSNIEIGPNAFKSFLSEDEALDDMRRCADLERAAEAARGEVV